MEYKKYREDDLMKYTYSDEYAWQFIANITFDNAEVFVNEEGVIDNCILAARLTKMGAVTKGVTLDPEMCCFYAYFKTKRDGIAFLKKLNAYLSQKANLMQKAKEF